MSNAAKVTVVIPNYNGLKFMEPCFKALNMQICRDFEILVVDNGCIAQWGTHEELMEQGGLYRRFIEIREQAEGWRLA